MTVIPSAYAVEIMVTRSNVTTDITSNMNVVIVINTAVTAAYSTGLIDAITVASINTIAIATATITGAATTPGPEGMKTSMISHEIIATEVC